MRIGRGWFVFFVFFVYILGISEGVALLYVEGALHYYFDIV